MGKSWRRQLLLQHQEVLAKDTAKCKRIGWWREERIAHINFPDLEPWPTARMCRALSPPMVQSYTTAMLSQNPKTPLVHIQPLPGPCI